MYLSPYLDEGLVTPRVGELLKLQVKVLGLAVSVGPLRDAKPIDISAEPNVISRVLIGRELIGAAGTLSRP